MNVPMDLADVAARVREKWQKFREYDFGTLKLDALMTFYDLAQEYETLENFYRVSVWVIKEFFDLDSRLYLLCPDSRLELVCDSRHGLSPGKDPALAAYPPGESGLRRQRLLDHPHRGNQILVSQLPFYAKDRIIGLLEIFPPTGSPSGTSSSSRSTPTAWATTCTSRSSPFRTSSISALSTAWWRISNTTSSSPTSASAST